MSEIYIKLTAKFNYSAIFSICTELVNSQALNLHL